MLESIRDRIQHLPGRAYLLFAVLIFAASNSVTRKLTEIGAANLIDGRNPISFCNVLFVGNLCALVTLLSVYRSQLGLKNLKQLPKKSLLPLLIAALLSGALAPALIFSALQETSVNNVILIGRIEPAMMLALSILILKARVNWWVIAGAVVSSIGVVLTVLLQTPPDDMMRVAGIELGRGDIYTIAWAITAAIASIISKVTLQNIPLGLFSLVRNALGTVVFFVIAFHLFGAEHFMDVGSPLLWQWMLFYGSVIVVGGQLLWLSGLKRSSVAEVSLANSFNPIAGIIAAFLILGEAPTQAHYVGGFVIVIGIVLNQIGLLRAQEPPKPETQNAIAEEIEMSSEAGFKGI